MGTDSICRVVVVFRLGGDVGLDAIVQEDFWHGFQGHGGLRRPEGESRKCYTRLKMIFLL